MPTDLLLDVGRLHARYHGVDAAGQARLDEALRRLVADDLGAALRTADWPEQREAFAVCVRACSVPVTLDLTKPVDVVARTWAAALVAGVSTAVQARPSGQAAAAGGASTGVVRYRRALDAVLDLVRGVATGDLTRQWAWHQAGLVPAASGGVGSAQVACVLAGRPQLVPLVLVAAPQAVAAALDPGDWLAVARAVRPALGGHVTTSRPVESAPVTDRASSDHGAPGWMPVARAARAVVPEDVWATATAEPERLALAVLALAVVAPAASRTAGLQRLVADTAATASSSRAQTRGPEVGGLDAPSRDSHVDLPAGVSAATTSGLDVPQTVDRADQPVPGDAPEVPPAVVRSRYGGVLFAIHALAGLDVAGTLAADVLADGDLPVPDALTSVLEAATGVPADDPAVLVAAGLRPGQRATRAGSTPPPAVDDRLVELGRAVRSWTMRALDDAPDDPDLGWLWRREVTLTCEPGWVEATFALADVDLRVRRAGLDLDPGHVWWTGGVVRFRYA